jgi:hypothetical protein
MEELLEQIFAVLTTYGYEVWMSHLGTIPRRSRPIDRLYSQAPHPAPQTTA